MSSENTIQTGIIDYINALPQGRAENVQGNAQQSGRADINACIKGVTLKIEVKTEDTEYGRKGATQKQKLYLKRWARAGAISMVVYGVPDVGIMLRKFNLLPETCAEVFLPSGLGVWYDVQNKRWTRIQN